MKKRTNWKKILGNLTEKELVDWFKNFVEKERIVSRRDFSKRYAQLYCYYFQKLTKEDQEKILPSIRNGWSMLDNLTEKELVDRFKKFVEKEEIFSRGDLKKKYVQLYNHYFLKLPEESQNEILPSLRNNWCTVLDSLTEKELIDWFKGFVEKEKIFSRGDLSKKYVQLYNQYFLKLTKENQDEILPSLQNNWCTILDNLTEKELVDWFKDFVEKNEIFSRVDLSKKYAQLYYYFLKLSKESQNEILPFVQSLGEKITGKVLTRAGYVYTTQKTFPNLISKCGRPLFCDFYIERKNCLIEFHGEQHFNPKCKYYSKEGIERDRIKYQYAKDNGITIIYITDCVEVYEKYGYFAPVFTNWDDLIKYINSLPDVNVEVAA